MSKIGIYHSADNDGLACGAILHQQGYEVIGFDYNEFKGERLLSMNIIPETVVNDAHALLNWLVTL